MDVKKAVIIAIQKLMPDLEHYMRFPRKAKVTRVRKKGSKRLVDLKVLRNDGSVDPDSPPLEEVEMDTLGICPDVGATVTVSFFRGDPGAPVVTGILDLGRPNLRAMLFDAGSGKFFELDDTGKWVVSGATWTFGGAMAEAEEEEL